MEFMRRISLLFLFCYCCGVLFPQHHRTLRDDVCTLRCEVDGRLSALPVIQLQGAQSMHVSFDQMSHDNLRFFYRVEHCDFNWKPTEGLFAAEFMESTQTDVPIENHNESRNTSTLYTHYSFSFPNGEMRPLISGNYRITIFDDNGEKPTPVAEICCRVVEPIVGVQAQVSSNTDIDWNARHQQVSVELNAQALPSNDLREALKVEIVQNADVDCAVVAPPPTLTRGGTLIWQHCPDLIFRAGNESRSFEMLSTRFPGMHMERIEWFPPYFHTTLQTDEPRKNYLLVGDSNGTSVIRNTDNQDNATESEYVFVHFSLQSSPLSNTEIYIDGQWTNGPPQQYRMTYDERRQAYEAALWLKQGYYSYRYLTLEKKEGQPTDASLIEGDFFQTTNDYTILIYYQRPGERYTRLVGATTAKS